jgi:hypothetical protein
MLTGGGRLDGGVHREQMDFAGDVLNQVQDF